MLQTNQQTSYFNLAFSKQVQISLSLFTHESITVFLRGSKTLK